MTSLVSQLSWTHYTILISIQNIEKRIFYKDNLNKSIVSVPLRC
ncbi:hypothetical protein GQ472_05045 [archaeon]|nr:hypothetical protein [archaeon]